MDWNDAAPAGRGASGSGEKRLQARCWWCGCVCQLVDFPAFRLFDFLGSWKVGDLETWRGKASAQEGVRKCCRVWDVLAALGLPGGMRRGHGEREGAGAGGWGDCRVLSGVGATGERSGGD